MLEQKKELTPINLTPELGNRKIPDLTIPVIPRRIILKIPILDCFIDFSYTFLSHINTLKQIV